MKRDAELRRAGALIEKLTATSGNEMLLNPEQLIWYRAWQARRNSASMTDEEAAAYYAASLEDNYVNPDPIRPDIERILNHDVPVIYESDTAQDAAEKLLSVPPTGLTNRISPARQKIPQQKTSILNTTNGNFWNAFC